MSMHRKNQYGGVYLWYLLALLLLAGIVLLFPVYRKVLKAENERIEAEEKLRTAKEERAEIEAENHRMTTPRGVKKVGIEKYNMAEEGDTVLVYDR